MLIRRAVVEGLHDHACREQPNECCGLLIGTAELIERCAPARNLRASPTRYLIDPEDHFAALRSARARGWEVVGAYHSHPHGAPVPSPTDVREATYREFVYVIVSPGRGDTRAGELAGFRLDGETFAAVELKPVP